MKRESDGRFSNQSKVLPKHQHSFIKVEPLSQSIIDIRIDPNNR